MLGKDKEEYRINGKKEILESQANRAKGLTHREAAVLLECDDEELTDRMFKLAEDL